MPSGPGTRGKLSTASASSASSELGGLALDFGAAAPKKRTWRDSALADWQLQLAGRAYAVHRTILGQGERMSHFFLAQFERWEASGSTDLDSLLPEPCWPVFEDALDYIYEGDIALRADNVVPLLKIAHMLQIPTLGAACTAFLRANLCKETAPAILAGALQLNPGLEPLVHECMRLVAQDFDTYRCEEFAIFPAETMLALLAHPQLQAPPRHVSHAVAVYLRATEKSSANLKAAAFSHFTPYVQDVQPEDAVFLLGKAVVLDNADCRAACMRSVVQHFALVNIAELATVPDHNTIVELLDNDELATRDEDQILEAIIQYSEAREGELSTLQKEELLATCRFADLSLAAWESLLTQKHVPASWLYGAVARLIRIEQGEAEFEAFVARQSSGANSLVGKRLQRRKRHHELFFLHFSSPFDSNGVLYWIGTQGRTRTYQNPCESGDVAVKFSKMGTGNESHFVQHANSSQDCHTDDMKDSWMQVDLGPTRSLRANYYCLRHGLRLNEYCLRSWKLQGSNDSETWATLHECVNDSSLTGGGFTTAAWPIHARNLSSFRFFRIYQTGPSHSSCSDNLRVACAGIELYGDLFQQK